MLSIATTFYFELYILNYKGHGEDQNIGQILFNIKSNQKASTFETKL
jgi:hypothetical protein